MFKYPKFAIAVTSGYMLFFVSIMLCHASFLTTSLLFLLSQILVIWMVVSILKDPAGQGRELPEGAEWGYEDRPDIRPVV